MLISNAGYFNPNARQLKVELINGGVPDIYVSPLANAKMQHYVDIVSDEVGWLGTVEELECGDYLIEDVFLFEQRVSGATTEITEDALADFAQEVLQQEDGMEIMNKLRFWGHSHVNMATMPSGQDNDQMDTFASSGHDFFIRGIFNKKGEVNFSIYDYAREVIFHHVDWQLYTEENDELRDEIEAEIKEKVSKISYATRHNYPHGSIPYSRNYPQGGHYLPSKNKSWASPNSSHDDMGWDDFDDILGNDAEEAYFGGSHSTEMVVGDGIDEPIQELSEEEYEELTQKFHKDIAGKDVNDGRIPDDPQNYKYGR